MNRFQNAWAKLRRRSSSSKHEEDKLEASGSRVENTHRCAGSPSSQSTPASRERQDCNLRTAGGRFSGEKHCMNSYDSKKTKKKSIHAQSWFRMSSSSARMLPKAVCDSKKRRRRYNLIVDIGSGKDIPENETDVRPSFTFELIEDDDASLNDIYQRKEI